MNLSTVQELVHCDTINLIFLNTSSLCKNLDILISQKIAGELMDNLSQWVRTLSVSQMSFDVIFDALLKLWKSIIFNTSISVF
jgi:hypothetical protein